MDLDLPAGDAHFVDDESEELLALLEGEFVEAAGGAAGEVGDALPESVIGCEFLALGDQPVMLVGE